MQSGQSFRYRLDVQYDGTEFSGMQWQPERRTVQKSFEDALEPLFGAKVRVIPSSRTDAGVHAARQVLHVDVPVERNPASIVRACNVELPHDARIVHAEKVDENFHARFSAKWRSYQYRISQIPVAIGRQYVWQFFQPLDTDRLFSSAEEVLGTHVFSAFAHENPTEKHNYQSTVFRSGWERKGELLVYRIDASRFVHGMVRMIVGTMVDIATERGSLGSLREILLSCDNRNSGTKAPAAGLTLETVGYQNWPHA